VAVPESLQKLLDDGVIDEIQTRLMSGKEASVYVVSRRGEIVAAKVYKARDRRSFKSTSSYTEGRNQTRNSRDKRAMDRGSSYGKELMEDGWRDMEYRALFDAHHAGVRVPKPIMIYEDVLLMELLLDENGVPAPRLADFDLSADEAGAMLREVYRQVRMLLGTGRIHGDLSAFNILIAAGGPTIIDLPQVVEASKNNQAREILKRNLRNLLEHPARFDEPPVRFLECGEGLFQHFERGTLDEATEPREVRREHSGGRRMRGEERADGSVGQARRGPPQHQRGPQQTRGPQEPWAPQRPQHGGPQQTRGPQGPRGPQHDGPHQRGPQRGGPQDDGPYQRGPQHAGPQQPRGSQQQWPPQHPGRQQSRGPQRPWGPQHPEERQGPRGQQGSAPRGAPGEDLRKPQGQHARDGRGPQRDDRRGPPGARAPERGDRRGPEPGSPSDTGGPVVEHRRGQRLDRGRPD